MAARARQLNKARARKARYRIDYRRWATMDGWTPEEFAALCSRVDPKDVDDNEFKESSKFGKFDDLRNLAIRALHFGIIAPDCSPDKWLSWAQRKRIRIPAYLRGSLSSGKSKQDLGTRERKTVLKLILGMAVSRYGYGSDKKRQAVSEIQRDLDLMGLKVDDQTIRNWLKEAASACKWRPSGG